MLNKAILMGRLTRDPEMSHTQNNMAVTRFSLAIDRNRKSQNGERQTDFINCVAFGRQAEFVKQWFNKGAMAIVVGRIQTNSWEDKNGSKRVTVEIAVDEISFGESKKAREANGGYAGYDSGSQIRSESSYSYAQQSAPAFDLPEQDSDFALLGDDDGNVPF